MNRLVGGPCTHGTCEKHNGTNGSEKEVSFGHFVTFERELVAGSRLAYCCTCYTILYRMKSGKYTLSRKKSGASRVGFSPPMDMALVSLSSFLSSAGGL